MELRCEGLGKYLSPSQPLFLNVCFSVRRREDPYSAAVREHANGNGWQGPAGDLSNFPSTTTEQWDSTEPGSQLEKPSDVIVVRGPSGSGWASLWCSLVLVYLLHHCLPSSPPGKTTLLKCLASLEQCDEGSLTLNGLSVAEVGAPDWRSKVLYVPQHMPRLAGTPREFWSTITKFKSQKKITGGDPVSEALLPLVLVGVSWIFFFLSLSRKNNHRFR